MAHRYDGEEINDGIAGSNYGWPICEGFCNPPNPSFRDPIFVYQNNGVDCAITGGAFYNPTIIQFPSNFVGHYFFADFCGGWITQIDPATGTGSQFATGISSPVDLKVSEDGFLYLCRQERKVDREIPLSPALGMSLRNQLLMVPASNFRFSFSRFNFKCN